MVCTLLILANEMKQGVDETFKKYPQPTTTRACKEGVLEGNKRSTRGLLAFFYVL
jgi:hypothetical protein